MADFLRIEPKLKEWYGIDRDSLMQYILESVDPEKADNDPNTDKYEDDKGVVDMNRYAMDNVEAIRFPVSQYFDLSVVDEFCEGCISNKSDEYCILALLYILIRTREVCPTLQIEETLYDVEEYQRFVRPEMLRLYLALHKDWDNKDRKCKITFYDASHTISRTGELDAKVKWLQEALESYLDKYLGVKDIKEAELELLNVYGKQVGAKMNTTSARYMWGTYHLLQTTEKYKSKTVKSVTNDQSRKIADFLIRLHLIGEDYRDGATIRGQLNYYLKTYESVDEFVESIKYKTSPNNVNGTKLY